VHTIANLALRSRTVTRPDNRMALTAHSDESLVIDSAAQIGGTINEINTINAIAYVIHQPLPGAAINYTGAPAGSAVNQTQVDTDKWDTIADLADRIDCKVYDDGLRQWWIQPTATLGTPALSVAPGVGGTLIESDADLNRDDFANWVILRYLWTDAANVRQRVVASQKVQTGTYAATTGNTKMYLEERDTPTTQAQADAAAAALVKRMVSRGRALRIVTPSAYWVRPGDTLTVQLPTGDPETHLVASVQFDLKTGLMDITTRLPDNTGTIGA